MKTFSCWSCGAQQSYAERLSFRAECDSCGADLHSCKGCEFYDAVAYNECREPSAEVQREKDRNNRCDFFAVTSKHLSTQQSGRDILAQAEALFKKK